jgi:hypothetical protein
VADILGIRSVDIPVHDFESLLELLLKLAPDELDDLLVSIILKQGLLIRLIVKLLKKVDTTYVEIGKPTSTNLSIYLQVPTLDILVLEYQQRQRVKQLLLAEDGVYTDGQLKWRQRCTPCVVSDYGFDKLSKADLCREQLADRLDRS